MSLPQLTKPYIIGPPTFCLFSSPITARPRTLFGSHNNPLVKFLILWGFSACSYFCSTIPPDNLTAPTLRSLLLKNHFVTDLHISTPCHFLFPYCFIFFPSTYYHLTQIFIFPPPTGIEYYASSHWKRNSLELLLAGSLLYSGCLGQSLAYSRCSINIYILKIQYLNKRDYNFYFKKNKAGF